MDSREPRDANVKGKPSKARERASAKTPNPSAGILRVQASVAAFATKPKGARRGLEPDFALLPEVGSSCVCSCVYWETKVDGDVLFSWSSLFFYIYMSCLFLLLERADSLDWLASKPQGSSCLHLSNASPEACIGFFHTHFGGSNGDSQMHGDPKQLDYLLSLAMHLSLDISSNPEPRGR